MRFTALASLGFLLLGTPGRAQPAPPGPDFPDIRDYPDPKDPFSRMLAARFQVLVNAVDAGDRETAFDMRTSAYRRVLEGRHSDTAGAWREMRDSVLKYSRFVKQGEIFHARASANQVRLALVLVVPDEQAVYVSQWIFVMFRREGGIWRIGSLGVSDSCAHCSPSPQWAYYPKDLRFRLPGEHLPRDTAPTDIATTTDP